MSSTLERLESLEKNVEGMSTTVKGLTRFAGISEMIAQRVIAVEQSAASMGKILSSLVNSLIAKGLVTDAEIFTEMVNLEQNHDKQEVKALLESNVIAATDVVAEGSFVVASQQVDGDDSSLVDYRLYKLSVGGLPEAFVQDLIGKKVGDIVFSKIDEEKVLKVVVKEVYNLVVKE